MTQLDVSEIESITEAASGTDRKFVSSAFYQRLTKSVQAPRRNGPQHHKLLLRYLLDQQATKIPSLPYPASVRTQVEHEFRRIESGLNNYKDEYFQVENHALRCDYRILFFSRVPAGVEHMEIGGIPRSLAVRGGISQTFRFLKLWLDVADLYPWINIHLKHGIKPWTFLMVYSADAQEEVYRNVADTLLMQPHVSGLIATSWWYDPQLDTVAPHMSYLRATMLENGAYLFRWRRNATHGLANSATRKQLHDQGDYTPCAYTIVWPRARLLEWAGR